jgi:polo-like kinase 1
MGTFTKDLLLKEKQDCDWNEIEEPYIMKWIDYSNKYGLGYILTTEACGVYFNDTSKMILAPDFVNLHYIEKGLEKKDSVETHTFKSYPQ